MHQSIAKENNERKPHDFAGSERAMASFDIYICFPRFILSSVSVCSRTSDLKVIAKDLDLSKRTKQYFVTVN